MPNIQINRKPPIVTSGLVLHLDANNNSHVKSSHDEINNPNFQHQLDKPNVAYAAVPAVSHGKYSKTKSSFQSASKTKKNQFNTDEQISHEHHYLHQLSNGELNKNEKHYYNKVNSGSSINCIGIKVFEELTQHALSNQV